MEVGGLRWAIAAKQDVAEAFASANRLKRDLLVVAAAAAIALTFLALACAGLFMRPVRRVIAGMHAVNSGTAAAPIEVRGNDEFAELARGYNRMADVIKQRDKRLADAELEKGELLRSIYPAGMAERLRSGAEVTAETVSNVTVAVVLIDGLDVLAANLSAEEVRSILNALLDALNNAATSHGVEPLRSIGRELRRRVWPLLAPAGSRHPDLGLGTHRDAGLPAHGRRVGEIRVPAFRARLRRDRRGVDRAWPHRLQHLGPHA